MDKETKEILSLFLDMYAIDKCHCGFDSISHGCPIHDNLSISNKYYNRVYEALNSGRGRGGANGKKLG